MNILYVSIVSLIKASFETTNSIKFTWYYQW
jgi:hypothetical protein